MLALLKFIPML